MENTLLTMTPKIEKLLNKQIYHEHHASHRYLKMATWAELEHYDGAASFFYAQSREETTHMMKIVAYLLELEKKTDIPNEVPTLDVEHSTLRSLFDKTLQQEMQITQHIHALVAASLEEKDFRTFAFLQWFVEEQRKEEAEVRKILGLFELLKEEGLDLYTIDQKIKTLCEEG